MTAPAPALIDILARNPRSDSAPVRAEHALLLSKRHVVRRFVLDEQGNRFLTDTFNALYDQLDEFRLSEFAIPPFPETYVEMRIPIRMEDEPEPVARALGFCILNDEWHILLDAAVNGNVVGMLVHWNSARQAWAGPKSELIKDGYEEQMRTLLQAVQLLFVLMGRKVVRYRDVPVGHRIYRGKRTTYAAHSEVSIALNNPEALLRQVRAASSARAKNRHHEVRGHYVHYRTGSPCALPRHDYQPVESEDPTDTRKRWRCACGALRVWRTYPEGRGDATKGHVRQEYRVTARQSSEGL